MSNKDEQARDESLPTELPANPTAVQTATWARQERFLAAYSGSGGIYKAAAVAECSPRTVENWLNADNFGFQKRYHVAQARYLELMAAEADRRGMEGVAKPVYQGGKKVGTVQTYSDNLLMFRMKKLDPAYRDSFNLTVDVPDELAAWMRQAQARDAEAIKALPLAGEVVDAKPASGPPPWEDE